MQTTYPHASGYPLRRHPQAPQPPSPQQASRHPPVGRPLPPGSATLTPTSGVGVKMMTATTRGTSCTHARAKAVASAERTWGMAMSCRRKECAGHLRVEAHVIDLDRGLERAMQRLERKEGIDLAPPFEAYQAGDSGRSEAAIRLSVFQSTSVTYFVLSKIQRVEGWALCTHPSTRGVVRLRRSSGSSSRRSQPSRHAWANGS